MKTSDIDLSNIQPGRVVSSLLLLADKIIKRVPSRVRSSVWGVFFLNLSRVNLEQLFWHTFNALIFTASLFLLGLTSSLLAGHGMGIALSFPTAGLFFWLSCVVWATWFASLDEQPSISLSFSTDVLTHETKKELSRIFESRGAVRYMDLHRVDWAIRKAGKTQQTTSHASDICARLRDTPLGPYIASHHLGRTVAPAAQPSAPRERL